MLSSSLRLSSAPRLISFAGIFLALLAWTPNAIAQSAYVRVSQVGYEAGATPFRAYLMSAAGGQQGELQGDRLKRSDRIFGTRRRIARHLES